MTIKVGSARIDEHGNIRGGSAGDQTGKEVATQNAYIWTGGWDCCVRIKNEAKRKKFIKFIKWACANELIGYDQSQRLTLYNAIKGLDDYHNLKKKVECDCSSLVACGLIMSGFPKISPSCTTSTLESNMKKNYPNSFTFFDSSYKSGNHTKKTTYWRDGDIINKRGHHVVTVVSGGNVPSTYYPKYDGNSNYIDKVFSAIGVPSKYIGSVSARKPVAVKNGITNYEGDAVQNMTLISYAKCGKLKKV